MATHEKSVLMDSFQMDLWSSSNSPFSSVFDFYQLLREKSGSLATKFSIVVWLYTWDSSENEPQQ